MMYTLITIGALSFLGYNLFHWYFPSSLLLIESFSSDLIEWVSGMLVLVAVPGPIILFPYRWPPVPRGLRCGDRVEGHPGWVWHFVAGGIQIFIRPLILGQIKREVGPLYIGHPDCSWSQHHSIVPRVGNNYHARLTTPTFVANLSGMVLLSPDTGTESVPATGSPVPAAGTPAGSRTYSTKSSATTPTATGTSAATKARAAKDEVMRLMFEKDTGQMTSNVQTLAKRWMASKLPPTVEIMNDVLCLPEPVTQAELNLCLDLLSSGGIKLEGTLKTASDAFTALFPSPGGQGSIKRSGVYIMRSLTEFAVGVGSALTLRRRCVEHLTQVDTKIGQYVHDHGPDSLQVTLLVLPEHLQGDKRMTVILEQVCFFMLFGVESPDRVINVSMVANSTGGSQTPEQLAAYYEQFGMKIFVTSGGVHVGTYTTRAMACKALGVGPNTLSGMTAAGHAIQGTQLRVYKELPAGTSVNLLGAIDFAGLVDGQLSDAIVSGLARDNSQVSGSATCTKCGLILEARSMGSLSQQLIEHRGKGTYKGMLKAMSEHRLKGFTVAKYHGFLLEQRKDTPR